MAAGGTHCRTDQRGATSGPTPDFHRGERGWRLSQSVTTKNLIPHTSMVSHHKIPIVRVLESFWMRDDVHVLGERRPPPLHGNEASVLRPSYTTPRGPHLAVHLCPIQYPL